MEEKDFTEREIFICECHSLEHQISFWYEKEDKLLYCEPHLYTHNNFFKRLWAGLKYTFGYKCRYGEWDCTILKQKDLRKLKKFLNENVED